MMTASTPISRTKSQALTRILDVVGRGYTRYTAGSVIATKAEQLANKFHKLYGIGCTPAQRITRKKHGTANTVLTMYWPDGAVRVEWLLLATAGDGLTGETLADVTDRRRLQFLGYELVRYAHDGRTRWTWKRPKVEMAEHYVLLAELANKHAGHSVKDLLARLANQPGFHGVRTQSWELCQEARRRGYAGELPHLFYMQKISHGDPLKLL
ncbi:MAG: hypothetical protein M0Z83_08790 [Betaproteobacteria bacterium]|nr:hypothetical protein [Betaproteobacteria bacterium]